MPLLNNSDRTTNRKNSKAFRKKDVFLINNFIFFIGSLLTALLNYLYHPLLSRLLPIETFGEVQALLSLLMLFGVITTVFTLMATGLVSQRENSPSNLQVASELQRLSFFICLFIAIGLSLAAPLLKTLLHFNSSWPFVALGTAVLTGSHLAFYTAWFQGIRDFITVSVLNILQASGKLLFALLFISWGWQTTGAAFAFFCAGLCAILYGIFKAKNQVSLPPMTFQGFSPAFVREMPYGLIILFGSGFVALLSFSDIVIVKALFSPEEAGLYSGIATIARIIFFLTTSVGIVLLPSVNISARKEANFALLLKSMGFLLLLGGSCLLFFTLFPSFSVAMLIGEPYKEVASLLPLLSLEVFLVSSANLLIMYLIALRRFILFPIVSGGTAVLGILIICNHGSLQQIVMDYLLTAILVLGALSAVVMRERKSPSGDEICNDDLPLVS